MRPIRLLIFDADDTLRRCTVPGQPCPHHPDEWELLPDVRAVLHGDRWRAGGMCVGIASNQDHVGYGLLSEAMARRMMQDLVRAAFGVPHPPARVEICPHRPEERCTCRKPEPAMLQRIMHHFAVPAGETLFVGNAESDESAAHRAGVRYCSRTEFFGLS